MRTLFNLSVALFYSVLALFRSREEQAVVELALRQQLAVVCQKSVELKRTHFRELSRVLNSSFRPISQGSSAVESIR